MSTKKDHYSELGVTPTASSEEIKRAYRALVKEFHPDRNHSNPDAEAKFKAVAEAYEVVGDDHKRKEYDRSQSRTRRANFNGSGIGDVFSSFFDDGSFDIHTQVLIDFDEAVTGCTKTVTIEKQQHCTDCQGLGAKPEDFQVCSGCRGTGYVRLDAFPVNVSCTFCGGMGQIPKQFCPSCQGKGYKALPPQEVTVKIPAGINSGQVIEAAGEGNIRPTGKAGILKIAVLVGKHAYFKRDGMDLLYVAPLTYSQLILGDKISIPKLDGVVTMDIPSGTKPGTKFRLWGLGMPSVSDSSHRGDLIVLTRLDIPQTISNDYKEALTKLAEVESKHISEARAKHAEIVSK